MLDSWRIARERLVEKSKTFSFNLLPSHDPNTGTLEVTVTPNLATGLLQSLDQLVQFPYGCVEQTLSRFLPAIRVVRAIRSTSLHTDALEHRADKIAVDGFARLQKMQHGDGGWGWWTYDESDPFMTAWVLDGLLIAKDCGKNPPAGFNLHKALQWATSRFNKPLKDDQLEVRLYLLLTLTEYAQEIRGAEFLKTLKLSECSNSELSLIALAAGKLGLGALENSCFDLLEQNIRNDVHHGRSEHLWWSPDEESAIELRALVTLRPRDPLLRVVAMRLEKGKRWNGWISTRATTMATVALCDYIETHSDSLVPDQISIRLNGHLVKNVTLNPLKLDLPTLRLAVPISKLMTGANSLVVTAEHGEPYIAAELRQYVIENRMDERIGDNEFSVRRSYHRMEPTRTDDGSLKLLPTKKTLVEFQSGDVIRCEIVVHCDRPVDFLLVEDPVPSNCRVTDREDPMDGEIWEWWWSDLTIMDDHVALFARHMSKGDHKLSYTLRAEGSGSSSVLPTHALNMYAPQFNASGAETLITVN